MKRLLSLLLVLGLVLGMAGCQAAGDFWQTLPSAAQTDGTTEPLFWPPLPSETEETVPTTAQTEDADPQEQTKTPAATKPSSNDSTDATYIPRDDEETRPREEQDSGHVATTAPETEPATEPETEPETQAPTTKPTEPLGALDPNGTYDSKEDVALFIVLYGRLPNNYYTKSQAKRLFGWSGGSLDTYEPGACIGGDRFYNNEGNDDLAKGHTYYECDIGTIGSKYRGAQRLVFTYDGLVYYTHNHYDSFILLYGTP